MSPGSRARLMMANDVLSSLPTPSCQRRLPHNEQPPPRRSFEAGPHRSLHFRRSANWLRHWTCPTPAHTRQQCTMSHVPSSFCLLLPVVGLLQVCSGRRTRTHAISQRPRLSALNGAASEREPDRARISRLIMTTECDGCAFKPCRSRANFSKIALPDSMALLGPRAEISAPFASRRCTP